MAEISDHIYMSINPDLKPLKPSFLLFISVIHNRTEEITEIKINRVWKHIKMHKIRTSLTNLVCIHTKVCFACSQNDSRQQNKIIKVFPYELNQIYSE